MGLGLATSRVDRDTPVTPQRRVPDAMDRRPTRAAVPHAAQALEKSVQKLLLPLVDLYLRAEAPYGGRFTPRASEALRATLHQDVVIMVHVHPPPDLDAVASAAGMARVIRDYKAREGGSGRVDVFVPTHLPGRLIRWLPAEDAFHTDVQTLDLDNRTRPVTAFILDAADLHQLGDGARVLRHPAVGTTINIDHHGIEPGPEDLELPEGNALVVASDREAAATSELVLDAADLLGVRIDASTSSRWRTMAEAWVGALRMDDPMGRYPRGMRVARFLTDEVLGGQLTDVERKLNTVLPPDALALLTGQEVSRSVQHGLVTEGHLRPGERTHFLTLPEGALLLCPLPVQEAALVLARREPYTFNVEIDECHSVLMNLLDTMAETNPLALLLLAQPEGVRVCVRAPAAGNARELIQRLPGEGGGGDERRAAKTLSTRSLEEACDLVLGAVRSLVPQGV